MFKKIVDKVFGKKEDEMEKEAVFIAKGFKSKKVSAEDFPNEVEVGNFVRPLISPISSIGTLNTAKVYEVIGKKIISYEDEDKKELDYAELKLKTDSVSIDISSEFVEPIIYYVEIKKKKELTSVDYKVYLQNREILKIGKLEVIKKNIDINKEEIKNYNSLIIKTKDKIKDAKDDEKFLTTGFKEDLKEDFSIIKNLLKIGYYDSIEFSDGASDTIKCITGKLYIDNGNDKSYIGVYRVKLDIGRKNYGNSFYSLSSERLQEYGGIDRGDCLGNIEKEVARALSNGRIGYFLTLYYEYLISPINKNI